MKNLVKLLVLVLMSTTFVNCAKEDILLNKNGNDSTEIPLKHSDDDDDIIINGKAVGNNGMPVVSANVALSLNGSPLVLQTTSTDAYGEYNFANLANNTYDVQISKSNYQTITIQLTWPFSSVEVDTLVFQ